MMVVIRVFSSGILDPRLASPAARCTSWLPSRPRQPRRHRTLSRRSRITAATPRHPRPAILGAPLVHPPGSAERDAVHDALVVRADPDGVLVSGDAAAALRLADSRDDEVGLRVDLRHQRQTDPSPDEAPTD